MLIEKLTTLAFAISLLSRIGDCEGNSRRHGTKGSQLIGYPCDQDSDCVGDWPRTECSPQKLCVCSTGFIQKNDLTDCLRIRNVIDDDCEEPQQCQAGKLGRLSDCQEKGHLGKVCDCMEIAVSASKDSECLLKATEVEGPCQTQHQCLANLGHSSCIDGKCLCLSTAVPSTDRRKCLPKKYIGEDCEDPAECTHLLPIPVNCHLKDPSDPDLGSECRCNRGFANPPGENDICYELAPQIGGPCDEDPVQCKDLEGAQCLADRCACDESTQVVSEDRRRCLAKQPDLHGSCEESGQCATMNSECVAAECRCLQGTHVESVQSPNTCVEIVSEVGHKCTEDIQCTAGSLGSRSECSAPDPVTGDSTCQCNSDGFIIPPSNYCYQKVSHVGEACEIDEQCRVTLGDFALCDQMTCICGDGSIESSTNDRCLQGPVKVGEECEDNNQCPGASTGGECFVDKCRCKDGFVASIDLDDCLVIRNELGEPCTELQQCQEGTPGRWSECSEETKECQCSSEGVAEENGNFCFKKATKVGDECSVELQCASGLGFSECLDGSCSCIPEATPNDDMTRCVMRKYLGDACDYQYECNHIPFSASCQMVTPGKPEDGRVCRCNVGYLNPPGEFNACYKLALLIGDSCEHDSIQCSSIQKTYCVDEKCQCDEDTHVPSQDRKRCLEKAPTLYRPCEENGQCLVGNSACIDKRCICAPGYVESVVHPGTCVEIVTEVNAPCTENIQCTSGIGESSECSNGFCSCKLAYGFYEGRCYLKSVLDGRCEVDPECIVGVNKYAYCNKTDNRCSCLDTSIRYQNACFRKALSLGEFCEIDAQCTTNLGRLSHCGDENKCSCLPGSVPDLAGKKCVPSGVLIGDPCELTSQCVGSPGTSECVGICNCVPSYVSSNDRRDCLAIQNEIGGACKEDQQCTHGTPGELSECTPEGTCQCGLEGITEPDRHRCFKKAGFVGDACEVNIQCTANLGLSYCFNGNQCRCLDYATENKDKSKCIRKRFLDEPCTEIEECSHIPYSASCLPPDSNERKCKCNQGYLNPSGVNNFCYELASTIGDKCEYHEIQCSSIENAICSRGNKTCLCPDTHFPDSSGTKCLLKGDGLNVPCEDDAQCGVANSKCESTGGGGGKTCQCMEGYVESKLNQDRCLEICENVDLPCEDSVQCQAGIGNPSECVNSVCRCLSGFTFYKDKCHFAANLGGECQEDEECHAGVNNLTECNQKLCKCLPSAITFGNSCLKKLKVGDACSSDAECRVSIKGDVLCSGGVCTCFMSESDKLGYTCGAFINAIQALTLVLSLILTLNLA